MSKKAVFLQLSVAALAVVAVVIYFNITNARAANPTDPLTCLIERSRQLIAQRRQQRTPPLAVYFVPPEALIAPNLILTPEVLTENNIHPVTSLEELMQRTVQAPPPAVIYLHPDVVDSVDDAWLRQQYEAGIGIVALNTLVSELSRKLNADPRLEDLRLEYRRGRAFFALFHKASASGRRSEGVTADFVESPEFIPFFVNQIVDTYYLTDEYLEPVKACLK